MAWHKCTNGSCSRAGWCKRVSYSSGNDVYDEFECGSFNDWHYYVRNKAREIYERENPQDAFDKSNETEHENNNRESGVWEDDDPDPGIGTSGSQEYTTVADRFLQLLRSCIGRGSDPRFVSIGEDGEINIHTGSDILQNTARDGVSSTGPVDPESAIRASLERVLEAIGYPDNHTQDTTVEDTEG